MLISELHRALKEIAYQATANTRTAAELDRRCICVRGFSTLSIVSQSYSRHGICLSQNIMKKRRRESTNSVAERRWLRSLRSVAIAGSKMCQIESICDCWRAIHHRFRLQTLRTWRHLAARTIFCLACLPQPGSASTLGMFSPVSTGLESARDPGPSTTTVDSDAAQVTEFTRGISSGRVKDAHQEGTGSSSATFLSRKELIPNLICKRFLQIKLLTNIEKLRQMRGIEIRDANSLHTFRLFEGCHVHPRLPELRF